MIISNEISIQLIGIHGHAQTGKDTVAEYLYLTYEGMYGEPLAEPLKESVAAAFGINIDDFYDADKKEEKISYWGRSPREIAQFMGTEIFRNIVSTFVGLAQGEFWVQRLHGRLTGSLFSHYPNYETGNTVVITDVRFQEEYEYITQNGGIVIHIKRDGKEGAVGLANHASEGSLTFTEPEVTYELVNNGTKEEMYDKVEAILEHAKLQLTHKFEL